MIVVDHPVLRPQHVGEKTFSDAGFENSLLLRRLDLVRFSKIVITFDFSERQASFHATSEYSLTSFVSRSPRASAATSRSYWDCNPSQNSEEVPKNLPSLSAVSAVIFLFSSTISFILRAGTPMLTASLFWLSPIGFRNSSRSTSPGCTGCNLFFFIFLSSMIISNFHVGRVAVFPAKANTPLIVYANAVLP